MSGRVRPLTNPTNRSRAQTSQDQQQAADPSTAASGTSCLRARARARKQLDGCTINQTLPLASLAGLIYLSVNQSCSLSSRFAHDSLLICSAVTKMTPPLRGGVIFARLNRIVTLQNLTQCYHIASAWNWARGAQQQCRRCTAALHDPQHVRNKSQILNLKS